MVVKWFSRLWGFIKWGTLGLIIFLFLTLSTPLGKSALTLLLNRYAKTDIFTVKIKHIESFFPCRITLEFIHLWDRGNPWLMAQNIYADFDLVRLLRQHEYVGSLKCQGLIVHSLPEPTQTTPAISPKLPISLETRISINHIHIGPSAFGKEFTFSLTKALLMYAQTSQEIRFTLETQTEFLKSLMTLSATGQGILEDFKTQLTVETDQLSYKTLTAENLKFTTHVSSLPFKPTGNAELHFTHEGSPGHLRVSGIQTQQKTLSIDQIHFQGWNTKANAQLNFNPETWKLQSKFQGRIDDLGALSQFTSQQLQGQIGFKGSADINAENQILDIELKGENILSNFGSIGHVTSSLKTKTLFPSPSGSLDLLLQNILVNQTPLDSLTLTSALDKGKGQAHLQGIGQDIELALSSTLDLQRNQNTLQISQITGKIYQYPVSLEKPFEITISGTDFNLSPISLKIIQNPLELTGSYKNQSMNFMLKGVVDLTLMAQLFLYRADVIKGKLELEGTVQGDLASPEVHGFILLKDGFYENPVYGTRLENIFFNLKAQSNDQIFLDARATDGFKGVLTAKGKGSLLDQNYEIRLQAHEWRAIYTDISTAILEQANLHLRGDLKEAFLTGKINLKEASYDISKDLSSTIELLNICTPYPASPTPAPKTNEDLDGGDLLPFQFTCDLDILIPHFNLKGRGLSSLWQGQLQLKNTDKDLAVLGNLNLVRGQLEFLGQTLKLLKGKLLFDGFTENLPYLSLQASLTSSQVKALVDMQGRVNRPRITLSSEPPLPQDEILAFLLFGKDKQSLSSLEALKLLRYAAAMNSADPTTDFMGMLEKNLGIDTLTVNIDETSRSPTLRLGKNLTDQVNLSLDQGIHTEDTKAIISFQLTPNFSLETETGLKNSANNLALKYNWDH